MKRFTKVIAAALIAIIALMSVSALAAFSVVTTARVNLRTAPGTSFASLGIVDKGLTLTVDEVGQDSAGTAWYHVNAGGKAGWICSTYTAQAEPVAPRYVTMTGQAYVRAGAGLNYAALGALSKGTVATYLNAAAVDGRGVVWYRVTNGSLTGWVSSKYAVLN